MTLSSPCFSNKDLKPWKLHFSHQNVTLYCLLCPTYSWEKKNENKKSNPRAPHIQGSVPQLETEALSIITALGAHTMKIRGESEQVRT